MEYLISMKNFIFYFSITALLCVFCGCSEKPHKKPPTEKLALTVRFFDSIAAGKSDVAVRQGQKLYDTDNSQDFILRLIAIQESNEAVGNAQKLIRRGKIAEAVNIIDAAKKQYPKNQTLDAALIQVKELRDAEKLFRSMRNAKNASAMRSARIAAKARLSRNQTPALAKYFENYEKLEKFTEIQERTAVARAEKQASSAAAQASAADRRREGSNRQFQQSSSQQVAEGEKLRNEAGDIPFEDPESQK